MLELPEALAMEIQCSPVSEVLGRARIATGSSKLTFLQSAQREGVPEASKSQPPA